MPIVANIAFLLFEEMEYLCRNWKNPITMKLIKLIAAAVPVLFAAACTDKTPSVVWNEGQADDAGKACHEIILKNVPGGSRIWFARIPRKLEMSPESVTEITHYKGNSFYFDVPEHEGKELSIKYLSTALPRKSWAPEGFVLQRKGQKDQELAVEYNFIPREGTEPEAKWFAKTYEPKPADIIPAVKEVTYGEGHVNKPDYSLAKITVTPAGKHPVGWYRISIGKEGASVEAAEEDGFFYARTTYEKLPQQLPPTEITDWPDLPYRGIMLDVARNFLDKEGVKKIIDIVAGYKVNHLHFHIVDDEGWRIEIPQLPELTTFASRHALPVVCEADDDLFAKKGDLYEPDGLMPSTDGRVSEASSSYGFYTQEDYKEIIKYAWERRIKVIPEFDSPGHSRAAIRSMEAYERRTGDGSFRLANPADTSKYTSAQSFNDNVLEVEYPGVYKFMECIFDNVIKMHKDAGVPLAAIHIGGDEVPYGAWSGRSRIEMKDLFIRRMMEIADRKGVKLAGWQEITQNIKPETATELATKLYFVNAWSTQGRLAETPYRLANQGFPTLLSNVENLYIDLAYSDGPDEKGLTWGGYVDERKTFALQPYRIYESVRWDDVDTPKDLTGIADGKMALERPENIIGVQVQLWSENLRNFGDYSYSIFPKAIGAFERGWNARPSWPDDDAFLADWDRFYSILAAKEFPKYEALGLRYKKR